MRFRWVDYTQKHDNIVLVCFGSGMGAAARVVLACVESGSDTRTHFLLSDSLGWIPYGHDDVIVSPPMGLDAAERVV